MHLHLRMSINVKRKRGWKERAVTATRDDMIERRGVRWYQSGSLRNALRVLNRPHRLYMRR